MLIEKTMLGKNRKSFEDISALRIYNELQKRNEMSEDDCEKIIEVCSEDVKPKILAKLLKKHVEFNEKTRILTYNYKLFKTKLSDNKIFNELIRPEYIHTKKNKIQVGSKFYQSIFANGFPSVVENNWLGNLVSEKSNVDFTIHISPSSISDMEEYLNKQLRQVENDLYIFKKKGVNNQSLENRKNELIDQLNSIIRGDYKLYHMGLFMIAKGTENEVEIIGNNVKSSMLSEGIESEEADYYQEDVLKTVMPTSTNSVPEKMLIVPSPALSASFPFSSSFYNVDEGTREKKGSIAGIGTLLGFNDNFVPIAKSVWRLPKYVGCVIGASGSGKSYATKAFILNEQLVNRTKFIILDPEDEYYPMLFTKKENRDGSYDYVKREDVNVSCKMVSLDITQKDLKKKIPNILDFGGVDFISKLALLPKIYDVLLGELRPIEKAILEEASINAYNHKRIYVDDEKSWKNQAPDLSDVLEELKKLRKQNKDKGIDKSYHELIIRLDRYVHGIFSFINSNAKMEYEDDITIINLKGMADEIRPLLMLIMLEFIRTSFAKEAIVAKEKEEPIPKKFVVLDEAWKMLKTESESNYIEHFARTFRKINGGLLLITQSVAELKDCPQGRAFLANTSFKYILRTEIVTLDETCKVFGLNSVEKEMLSSAVAGEGILVWDNVHYKINVHVDPYTHKLITTNPNEK